jgi:protein gp37
MSPGCKNCYAERMAHRLRRMGAARYRNGFKVTPHPDVLELPLTWRRPRTIFVNSMSDLFHEDVSLEFILQLFDKMTTASWHTFQVLTKRSERLAFVAPRLPWPANVWAGVSVESQAYVSRVDHLRQVPVAVRFVSLEPLLTEISEISLEGIDWVIVGGESGPNCRPMNADWVRKIRDRCVLESVPFFFKQWGGKRKGRYGRVLDGRTWDQMPVPKNRTATDPLRVLPGNRCC